MDHLSNVFQYIELSNVHTLYYEDSLPKMPIPDLKSSCDKFLAALTPILTSKQMAETKAVTKKFLDCEGKVLDQRLRDLNVRNSDSSYNTNLWYSLFLSNNASLPLWSNIIVLLKGVPPCSSQIERATNIIISTLRFRNSVEKGCLSPDVRDPASSWHNCNTPLLPPFLDRNRASQPYASHMYQHAYMFNSCRIPGTKCDYMSTDRTARHIIVTRLGHVFKFDVVDENGFIFHPTIIEECVRHIVEMELHNEIRPIALLTYGRRREWKKIRDNILTLSVRNKKAFLDIESAIFSVNLDHDEWNSDDSQTIELLRGGKSGAENRWWWCDKPSNWIISKKGQVGCSVEHSWLEGITACRVAWRIEKDLQTHCFEKETKSLQSSYEILPQEYVKEIQLDIDKKTELYMEHTLNQFITDSIRTSTSTSIHDHFGRNLCKAAKLGADSVIQLTFMITRHKLFKDFVPTIEYVCNAAFKKGMGAIARPLTSLARSFVEAYFQRPTVGNVQLFEMLRQFSKEHGQLVKEVGCGYDFDNHLKSLELLAESEGYTSEFFEHYSFKSLYNEALSSSMVMPYPVSFFPSSEGISICYFIMDDFVRVTIGSTTVCPASAFQDAYKETLKEFRGILETVLSKL